MADENPIIDFLERAAKRDGEKGGGRGVRDTREIADVTGLKIASVRRQLWKLVNAGLVEAYDGEGNGLGRAIFWAIKPK